MFRAYIHEIMFFESSARALDVVFWIIKRRLADRSKLPVRNGVFSWEESQLPAPMVSVCTGSLPARARWDVLDSPRAEWTHSCTPRGGSAARTQASLSSSFITLLSSAPMIFWRFCVCQWEHLILCDFQRPYTLLFLSNQFSKVVNLGFKSASPGIFSSWGHGQYQPVFFSLI